MLVRQRLGDVVGEAILRRPRTARIAKLQLHQFLRIAHRQLAQHEGVDQTEDGSVGSDAERQGEHGCRRKSWIVAQSAECVLQVAPELLQPGPAPRRPGLLRGARDVTQLAGLGYGGQRLQFRLHVALFRPPMGGQQILDPPEPHHLPPSGNGPMICPTAETNPVHLECSAWSCLRPAGVSR